MGGDLGERLPNVPRFTGTVNADYLFSSCWFTPSLGGTVSYVSDRPANFDASSFPQYWLPSYTTVDLRAGVRFGRVDAQLYARNLLDNRGQLSAFIFTAARAGAGDVPIAMLQPLTVGLSFSVAFQ